MSGTDPLPDIAVTTKPKEREDVRTRRLPPYNVILENDEFHSFEFVVDVIRKALGYNEQRAVALTYEAHTKGRSIVWTGSKEVAELKAEQIDTFHEKRADGRDLGPLCCLIEPAPGA